MEYRIDERTVTLMISGELDHHTLRGISRELGEIIDIYLPKRLVFDMSAVRFMDSSGIALIIKAIRRMTELSGEVVLRSVPPAPMKIFTMAGISRYVTVEEGGKAV